MASEPLSRRELARLARRILDDSLSVARNSAADPALDGHLKALANVRALLEAEREITARRRQRYLSFVVLCGVAVVLVLASVRTTSVQIDLHARASRAAITSRESQNLTGLLALTEAVLLGNFEVDAPSVFGLPTAAAQLKLSPGSDPIVMEPIEIISGDVVTLERVGEPGRYRLQIEAGRPKVVKLTVAGHVKAATDKSTAALDVRMPRQIVATWSGSQPVNVTFATQVPALTQPIAIRGLDLTGLEEVGSVPRPVSTIVDGELIFPGYEKRTASIKEHEVLRTTGLDAIMASVRIKDDHLSLDVAGRATTVDLGAPARSQVPSLLEQVTKQTDWVIITGSLGALVATLWSMWLNPR